MTEEKNRFEQEQPLRHSLAAVSLFEDKIKINKQLYRIKVNRGDAINIDLLKKKYDPYLDQYDFIVGDISSDHLRLKGFYKDYVRTAIDKKEKAIADYLIEYCNPGTPYFVLELISPVHTYKKMEIRKKKTQISKPKSNNRKKQSTFKKRYVKKTKIIKKKTIAVKKEEGRKHSFVIKKREGN